MPKLEDFKTRLEHLIRLIENNVIYDGRGHMSVSYGTFVEFRASSMSLLKNLYDEKHPYFIEFSNRCHNNIEGNINAGLGILRSIKNEIDNGWLLTIKGIVSAELFSDFMEMAEHLLDEHYKDPAAVMIGSVLEEHLRQLCNRNHLPIYYVKDGKDLPRKADTINSDLAKAGVYNLLYQKQIVAWLDLRNKAAHGRYIEYSEDQVKLMYQGVLDFISKI